MTDITDMPETLKDEEKWYQAQLDKIKLNGASEIVYKDRPKKIAPLKPIFEIYKEKFGDDRIKLSDFKNKLIKDLMLIKEAEPPICTDAILEERHLENEISPTEMKILKCLKYVSDKEGSLMLYYRYSSAAQSYYRARFIPKNKTILNMLENMVDTNYKESGFINVYRILEFKYKSTIKKLLSEKKLSNKMIYGITQYKDDSGIMHFSNLPFNDWLMNRLDILTKTPSFSITTDVVPLSVNPKTPCLFYFDVEKHISEGETPHFDRWATSLTPDDKNVLMAYMFSIFDSQNNGRQALVLLDNGYSGKSSIINAMREFICGSGDRGKDLIRSIDHNVGINQFGFSHLYGARLIVYSDCKNSRVLQTELVHGLLGNDTVSIEYKGATAFSDRMNAKLIIGTNTPVYCNMDFVHERSRIILIKIGKHSDEIMREYCDFDKTTGELKRYPDGTPILVGGDLEKNLLKEMPHILNRGKRLYEEMCPNHKEIKIPDSTYREMLNVLHTPEQLLYKEYTKCRLILDPKIAVLEYRLMEDFFDFGSDISLKGKINLFSFDDFKRWLMAKYGDRITNIQKTDSSGDSESYIQGISFKCCSISIPKK